MQRAEPPSLEFPDPALVDLVERHWIQVVELLAALADGRHEVGRLEDVEVLAHRLTRHPQPRAEIGGSDFNFDFHVSFAPEELTAKRALYNFVVQDPGVSEREGVSVFIKDRERVFHTYSTYARGIDMLSVDYHYLDLVPRGRDEGDRGPYWVRRHDEYGR